MLGWWDNQPSDPAYYIEDCPILKAFISVLFRVAAYQNDKKNSVKITITGQQWKSAQIGIKKVPGSM